MPYDTGPKGRRMTKAQRRQLADQLRQAIAESGITLYQLSQESGVHRSQLSRFVREERDLGLAMAGKVCEVLGLHLTREGVFGGRPGESSDGPSKSKRPRKAK
jgi:transcriptional regulator with XRE-family HTH domain